MLTNQQNDILSTRKKLQYPQRLVTYKPFMRMLNFIICQRESLSDSSTSRKKFPLASWHSPHLTIVTRTKVQNYTLQPR
jgi:hypothetical protein